MWHKTVNVNTKDITLVPIADVQVGAAGVDTEGFREHVQYALTQPNPRFIGVGDYTDPVSPSNRKLLRAAFVKGELYDSFEDLVREGMQNRVDEFVQLMDGTQGKVDAVLTGHHYYTYTENRGGKWVLRTTDEDIADQLYADFFGAPDEKQPSMTITYRFPSAVAGEDKPELKVYLRHGQGGGDSFATPLNQLEKQMRGHEADVYIIAHHHKLVAGKAVKLEENPDSKTLLKATDGLLLASGSWMRGFLRDKVTYAEDGQMVPLAVGAPVVRVHRREDNTFRVKVEM